MIREGIDKIEEVILGILNTLKWIGIVIGSILGVILLWSIPIFFGIGIVIGSILGVILLWSIPIFFVVFVGVCALRMIGVGI